VALREWRQLQRRRTNIRRIHRLVLVRDSSPGSVSAPDPAGALDTAAFDLASPFSPETTRRLWVMLAGVSNCTDAIDAVSAVLREACRESRGASPDRMIVALHEIWRHVRASRGRCPEAVVNRYRAVVAELLSLLFGEDLVGLP
jgi:hypothetical protein